MLRVETTEQNGYRKIGSLDRYLLFMEYFNEGKFASAQMILDEVWLDDTSEEKNFLGGLIQVAVSLYHLTHENPKGSATIYEKARAMLVPYGEKRNGVDLAKLLAEMDHLFAHEVRPDDVAADYTNLTPKISFESSF